jgi:hypothetical protein
MSEEMLTPPVADTEAVRRDELMAKCAELGIRTDRRFSIKRMEDLIAEKTAALNEAVSDEEPAPSLSDLAAELAALKRENDALKAQKSSVPPGTLTTTQMMMPGHLGREEEERRALLEQAARLGISRELRPGLNNDGIRDRIMARMAEQAAIQAVLDEQDRLKAVKAPEARVTIRVLPLGDKKISKGVHIPGVGDVKYSYGDLVPDVLISAAKVHQANGYAEIVAG